MFRAGKIALMVIAVVFLFLIIKGIFGSSAEPNLVDSADQSISPSNAATTTQATNAVPDANSNASVNTNALSNVNTNSAPQTSTVDASTCDHVYSRGFSDVKEVALTFNVGTTKEGALTQLLTALKNAGAAAAFFARGDVASENPSLIQKISDAGFPVYNLTNTNIRATDVSAEELTAELEAADVVIKGQASTGSQPFFRPPYGATDDDVVATAAEAGYCTVTWTIDAMDWSTEYTAAASQARVLDNISNGAIVLMQASNATTAEIIPAIITALRDQGYALVDLPTLLGL